MSTWNPATNQNTPNFVEFHNSQQQLQEFIDTNIVVIKEEDKEDDNSEGSKGEV